MFPAAGAVRIGEAMYVTSGDYGRAAESDDGASAKVAPRSRGAARRDDPG